MTVLGSIYGVSFVFENEHLAGLEVDRHRIPIYPLRERLISETPLRVAAPAPVPPDRNPRASVRDGELVADEASRLTSVQDLGIGRRTIDVCQFVRLGPDGRASTRTRGPAFAVLGFGFDLTEKATWELVLPEARGVSKRDGGGVEIVARDGLTVQVDGPESLEIDPSAGSGAVIRCLLPPGKTGVRLKVSSRPAYKLGRTVVLCRPDQWKEAAIVASCLPGDRFTPLIVVDPPPLSSKEHEALFAELTAVVSKTMEYRGTDWARFELAENRWATPLEVVRTEARLQELLLQIAPQRSWLRHNDLVFQILRDLPLDRAVLLFPAQEGDLRAAGPEATDIPGQTMPPETRSILPEGVRRLYFLPAGEPAPADHEAHPYGDLAELAKLAWEALGPSGLAPGRTVDVPETSSSAFLTGLRRALIEGVPLRPVASGGDGGDATDGNRGIESDEAVLVEDSGHASAVVGVLYAHHRRAKLVTAPKQELGPLKTAFDEAHARRAQFAEDQRYIAVHRAAGAEIPGLSEAEAQVVREVPQLRDEPGTDLPEFRRGWFLSAVARFLIGDWRLPVLRRIEEVVAAQVPESVAADVGDRYLTAFTAGLPYALLKTKAFDWSSKPVAHVVDDASLLILSEIHGESAAREEVMFDLIYDPGFFADSETDDVVEALQDHFTYPILLSGTNATSFSLFDLPNVLPLETIFFITHGSDDAIMFGTYPLQSHKIPQWLSLPSRPLVFNNSCRSWASVGRSFLRCGARGYIGTLMSVETGSAAEFARVVICRLVADRLPVSEAIRGTGVDPISERSYVFIGTVSARLDQWPGRSPKGDVVFLASAARAMVFTVTRMLENRNAALGPLILDLTRQADRLRERLERLPKTDPVSLFDLSYQEIWACSRMIDRGLLRQPPDELVSRAARLIRSLPVAREGKWGRMAKLELLVADFDAFRGRPARSVARIQKSIRYAKRAKQGTGDQYLKLSDLYRKSGNYRESYDEAQRALQVFEGEKNELGSLYAIGRTVQVLARDGKLDQARIQAERGLTRAAAIRHEREQCAFASDLARIAKAQGRFDDGIRFAEQAIRLARVARDESGEVHNYGVLGNCYFQMGNTARAEEIASMGLAKARRLGVAREQADFLNDLGCIAATTGRPREASARFREAVALFAGFGAETEVFDSAVKWLDSSSQAALWDEVYRAVAAILDHGMILDRIAFDKTFKYVNTIIHHLKVAVRKATPKATRAGLRDALEASRRRVDPNDSGAIYFPYLARVVEVLHDWAEGRNVARRAQELDRASEGQFGLASLVAGPFMR